MGGYLFAQAFAAQNTVENMRAYLEHAFSVENQERELRDRNMRTWIAEDADGTAIGYAQLRLGAEPEGLSLANPSELARIYTDAAWHGQGVGARLLAQVVDTARAWGSAALWLGVWKENPRGIAFYQKHGFRIAGEQTFRLGTDPQHDWIMVRGLSNDQPSPATR